MRDHNAPGADLDLLCQAAEIVVHAGYAHEQLIQRRLRVGFTKAGRLLHLLENAGVIGPFVGNTMARDVLVPPAQLPGVVTKLRQDAADADAEADAVLYLRTLQFTWGGLFAEPADDFTHLVRGTRTGTPGPTLCGIDRFAPDTPGWSLGGGVTGPGITHTPCDGCVDVARRDFAGLPVVGMEPLAKPIAEALAVPTYSHTVNLPAEGAER